MDRQRDLELILKSSMPLVVIETRDESGMLDMLQNISLSRSKDDYLPLFRVFVLPSRTEGLPITILEAMQAGVALVTAGERPRHQDGGGAGGGQLDQDGRAGP